MVTSAMSHSQGEACSYRSRAFLTSVTTECVQAFCSPQASDDDGGVGTRDLGCCQIARVVFLF